MIDRRTHFNQHRTWTLPFGWTVTLLIGRPPQRPSDRLRTSWAVARSIDGLARANAACGVEAGRLICGVVGGGSSSEAICGDAGSGGGFGRCGNGTGARWESMVTGAVDLTTSAAVVEGGLGVPSRGAVGIDGGVKMAALAAPATTRDARTANPTRFMEAPCSVTQ